MELAIIGTSEILILAIPVLIILFIYYLIFTMKKKNRM